jgi:hypothetical protein
MKKKCNIKKIEIVDSVRFKDTSKDRLEKIAKFIGNNDFKIKGEGDRVHLNIKELNCGKRVNLGDHILKDSNGVYYVSTHDAFKKYKEKNK